MSERESLESDARPDESIHNTDWLTIADSVFEVPGHLLDRFRQHDYSIATEGENGRYICLINKERTHKMVFDQEANSVSVFRKLIEDNDFSDRIFFDGGRTKKAREEIEFMRRTGKIPKR